MRRLDAVEGAASKKRARGFDDPAVRARATARSTATVKAKAERRRQWTAELEQFHKLLDSGDEEGIERFMRSASYSTLVQLAQHGEKEQTRLAAAQVIREAVDGKPIQRTQIQGQHQIELVVPGWMQQVD